MGESLVVAGNTAGCMRPGGTSLTETALSRCSFPAGARLLDVGCGCAGTVECLLGHRFNAFGIDPSLTALRQGLERNDSLPLISAVGENLPFADGAWDGVFLECVLSIIRDS
ncbi:MAG TPA: methyltransferase domain-containing protein, partial [Syntrophobacteraceae bacterium]|nr:methyltransferase domain-containing protein [Syntrophobacteraceae bacterium]